MLLRFGLLVGFLTFQAGEAAGQQRQCKCGPDQSCWPSKDVWSQLNATIGGRLIQTVPIGAVCHDSFNGISYYNAAECAALKASWALPDPHLASSSSVMASIWANASCDPFDPASAPCRLDDYVQYTVNVTQQSDIKAALAFVQKHNIRLVIRNTGHDNLGRSTGHAALGIWLHYVTGNQFQPNYKSAGYSGPAVTVLAGESSGNLLAGLVKHHMLAVGGACPTVAVAGGHTTGGGHSPVSSIYGLGADNTLEFEVILANGSTVTASPTQNSDLFWALSGGGSGNYGVVWSMTIKTFPDVKVGTATLEFGIDANHDEDQFFEALAVWNTLPPKFNEAGGYTYTYFSPTIGNGSFAMYPFFGPNMTIAQINTLLSPLLTKLTQLKFPFVYKTKTYDSYYDAFQNAFQPWMIGAVLSSRLIPRTTIEQDNNKLVETERRFWKLGALMVHLTFNANPHGAATTSDAPRAVLPAWRQSDIHFVATLGPENGSKNYSLMVEQQATLTNVVLPALHDLAPNSGAYINEGDAFDPNWKINFFGTNYDRLLQVKRKYDPSNVLWVKAGVGSDALGLNSAQLLCQA